MTQKNSFNFKNVFIIFLLIVGIICKHCDGQVNREEANRPPDAHGGDGSAFFALRSCHQLLRGDSGEFFSPDYLCSNPPLWCNWTIQVDPGKRIHLRLEDLIPDDACHLKQDQIHVDEPVGHLVAHKVLQGCWREAKYTSSSSTLYVVLLIGGWPSTPYRGFYGRYQSFGPPVVYNPREGFTEGGEESESSPGLMDFSEIGPLMNSEQMEAPTSDLMYDYYDQHLAMTAELPWKPEEAADPDTEVDENLHPSLENFTQIYQFPAAPTVLPSTQRTFRSGRGVAHTYSSQSGSAVPSASPQQRSDSQELKGSTQVPTATRRNVEEAASAEEESRTQSWSEEEEEEEQPADSSEQAGRNRKEVNRASNQIPPPSEEPDLQHTDQSLPHPNMVEPLSDHRGNLNIRNHSEIPHLPGDHLFEVTVEVNFSQDLEETWDNLVRSLLLSVKAMMSNELEALHTQLSVSSKRIKRLSAGVLYILWLQIGQGPGGLKVRWVVHSTLQRLLAKGVGLGGNRRRGIIMSVSTADVNECGTQLVLCDVNADCANQFGSYSCHCRPGFQDESRLGSGGTICIGVKAAGCSSGLSPETKGVYVLFFLLSSLIVMLLLVVAGMLYRRHHRGAFLVRCHSNGSLSPPDRNNNHLHPEDSYSSPPDSDLPPPPPPAHLSLLRFSPLLPPDAYMDPQEGKGGKRK